MILLKLLALPITAPTNGFFALMRLIRDEVDKEQNDPAALRRRLVELQELLEAGAIDDAAYEELENDILDRLEALETDEP